MDSIENRALRLAIVTTHPIQYHAPWFHWMAANSGIELKVFYLWDFGIESRRDPGFEQPIKWDVPLLDGYDFEFVPNVSHHPGTDRFWGIRNPELLQKIQMFRPATALLIGYNYPSFLRLIFSWQRKFPLIFRGDSHRLAGSRKRNLNSEIRKRAIRAIFRRFKAVTYVGKANHEYFRSHGVAEAKLFYSPHAVDNERFMKAAEPAQHEARKWRSELGIPADHLVVLFAGKFEIKKRPLDLLEAFRRLGRADVSLLFVGSGELQDELRRRAESIPNAVIAPFQNQSEMPRTYAACDLFVLPSYGPEESWGLSVNEAFCLAKPAIVSSHVGCGADLIRPGETGLIFDAGDIPNLTAALREALSNRDRLRMWGENARSLITNYNYQHATAGLQKALAYALH